MKKIMSAIMAITMMATMAACGGTPASSSTVPAPSSTAPSSAAPAPAPSSAAPAIKTATPGKLTIGTSADFAPYEFHILKDGKDSIVGFDMAMAKAIADDMGLELEIKDISFDSILLELNAGTIDLGIAGFSPTPERLQAVDMSNIYYTGGQSLMINKKDKDKYKSYTDFDSKDFSVGAQTGSIQEELAKKMTPNAAYVGLQAVPQIIMELKAGKINAAYMETIVADGYAKTQDDLVILCEVPFEAEGSAVAIKKGNTALTDEVNKVIKKLTDDGSIGKFVEEANALAGQELTK